MKKENNEMLIEGVVSFLIKYKDLGFDVIIKCSKEFDNPGGMLYCYAKLKDKENFLNTIKVNTTNIEGDIGFFLKDVQVLLIEYFKKDIDIWMNIFGKIIDLDIEKKICRLFLEDMINQFNCGDILKGIQKWSNDKISRNGWIYKNFAVYLKKEEEKIDKIMKAVKEEKNKLRNEFLEELNKPIYIS